MPVGFCSHCSKSLQKKLSAVESHLCGQCTNLSTCDVCNAIFDPHGRNTKGHPFLTKRSLEENTCTSCEGWRARMSDKCGLCGGRIYPQSEDKYKVYGNHCSRRMKKINGIRVPWHCVAYFIDQTNLKRTERTIKQVKQDFKFRKISKDKYKAEIRDYKFIKEGLEKKIDLYENEIPITSVLDKRE